MKLLFTIVLASSVLASSVLAGQPSAPEPIDSQAVFDLRADREPSLTTDGQGTWLAVWPSLGTAGDPMGPDWDILYARSTDNGISWTGPQPVNTDAVVDHLNDGHASVATDGNGRWIVLWSRVGVGLVFSSSDDAGTTWSEPVTFAAGSNHYFPHLAANRDGLWVAVWQTDAFTSTDSDIAFRRSTDGLTWSAIAPLNSDWNGDSHRDRSPMVALDTAGRCVAVWGTIGLEDVPMSASSTDGCQSWSFPMLLEPATSADGQSSVAPRVATDGDGHWLAIYSTESDLGGVVGPDMDVAAVSSNDGGLTWSSPVVIDGMSDDRTDWVRSLVTDGAGRWLALWSSQHPAGDGHGTDWDLFFAASLDNGATWSAREPLNLNAGIDIGDDFDASITTSGMTSWISVWESNDPLGDRIGIDDDMLGSRFRLPLSNTCAGDGDGDGFGLPGAMGCPLGGQEDCADEDFDIYPGADEVCDMKNNNCSDPIWPALPVSEMDLDGDGFRGCIECDDQNGSVWEPPGEVSLLTVNAGTEDPSTAILSWSLPVQSGASSVAYDVISSLDPADFLAAATCLGSGLAETTAEDGTVPPASSAIFYLVRALNDCPGGRGSLGPTSERRPRQGRSCP